MPNASVLVLGDYPDWDRAALNEMFDCQWAATLDEVAGQPGADSIRALAYKGHSGLDDADMARLPNLGVIANFGVGYDSIDVSAASARSIKVTNTPDVLTDDVADLAVGMLLAQSRRIVEASDWVRSGKWSSEGDFPLQRKASGKRCGIVGLGRIGRAIADRLAVFDMEMHYSARTPKETPAGWTHHMSIVEMAGAVDFLIIALSGGPDTAGMVTGEAIRALGPDGTLINISRGSTVDEAALLEALETGALGSAALDVFASEPHLDPRFIALDNVLLQPHQASGTVETRQAMGQLQRDNIAAFLADKPLITPVN